MDERHGQSAEALLEIIPRYDALVVRSETKVTAPLIDAGERLRIIARAGVGVDNIDVEAATRRGIVVVNSPLGNINAAAEHTVALLLALARHIAPAYASLRAGRWERAQFVGARGARQDARHCRTGQGWRGSRAPGWRRRAGHAPDRRRSLRLAGDRARAQRRADDVGRTACHRPTF